VVNSSNVAQTSVLSRLWPASTITAALFERPFLFRPNTSPATRPSCPDRVERQAIRLTGISFAFRKDIPWEGMTALFVGETINRLMSRTQTPRIKTRVLGPTGHADEPV
jgi:hypothetical protein